MPKGRIGIRKEEMSVRNDPTLKEAIRQAAPASVEYRLYYGDERVALTAIETRLEQLSRSTAAPIAYRRVVSSFLRGVHNRLNLPLNPAENS